MERTRDFTLLVDKLNLWIARAITLLLLPILVITLYGVVMRYLFNSQPSWGWQIIMLLFYPVALIPGGYVLSVDGHVKVDLIYSLWNRKNQTRSNVATFIAFLLFASMMIKVTISLAWDSVVMQESYTSYAFNGPIWPMKVTLAIGIILLAIQGIAIFIRNIRYLMENREK